MFLDWGWERLPPVGLGNWILDLFGKVMLGEFKLVLLKVSGVHLL
jgi:hypothetical protein